MQGLCIAEAQSLKLGLQIDIALAKLGLNVKNGNDVSSRLRNVYEN
jgi:hypothetical protein